MNKLKTSENLNVLQKTVIDILHKKRISYSEYSKRIYTALNVDYPDMSRDSLRSTHNQIILSTLGRNNLTYLRFKFIMEEVLHEDIDETDDIRHIRCLGRGGKDLRYKRFGRLVATDIVETDDNHLIWKCKCDCGNEHIVPSARLVGGNTQSCGCYARDLNRQRSQTHGMSKTREFKTWDSMKQRCYNPKSKPYPDYGGRGIKICDSWLEDFMNFYNDMGEKPPNMSIDRIDVNHDYEPGNCRWATIVDQNNNMRHTLRFDDDTPLGLFASDNDIGYHNALRWFNQGLTKQEMLLRRTKIGSNVCKFNDGTLIAEFVSTYNLDYHKVWLLFKKGYSKEEILTKLKSDN